MKLFTALLLLCVPAQADDGFRWQVTDTPGFQWAITERGGGDPPASATVVRPSPGSGGERPSLTAPEPSLQRTTVCQCQGYREHLCHCLKAGQKCHCTRTSGSVWAVNEQGRATHKTGKKADPRVRNEHASREQPSSTTSDAPASDNSVPRQKSDGRWSWTAPDGVQWWASSKPKSGDVVQGNGATWDCVDGRMVLRGSVMAADIAPKGHWETRRVCRGSYCEDIRVWIAE